MSASSHEPTWPALWAAVGPALSWTRCGISDTGSQWISMAPLSTFSSLCRPAACDCHPCSLQPPIHHTMMCFNIYPPSPTKENNHTNELRCCHFKPMQCSCSHASVQLDGTSGAGGCDEIDGGVSTAKGENTGATGGSSGWAPLAREHNRITGIGLAAATKGVSKTRWKQGRGPNCDG